MKSKKSHPFSRGMHNSYKGTLDFLYNQLPMYQRDGSASYKIDLARTLEMDKWFHHPHRSFRTIHIAGTNGKGSVAHMLASILMKSGLKVGLYTSPHLKDFRERIRINGEPVAKNYVVNYVVANQKYFDELKPSFFELTVFMAFTYFQKEQVDVAVIETGLGGRLDSTNVIEPDLSVIINIGHDHSEYLGDSLIKIASEKAGIIKPGIPVVIGETQPEVANIFKKVAHERGSKIVFADQQFKTEYSLVSPDQKQKLKILNLREKCSFMIDTDLMGKYQQKNIVAVLQAVEILRNIGYDLPFTFVKKGLEIAGSSTGLMGRWQIIKQDPLVICDTGHNMEGIREVVEQIKNTPYKKLHIVLGFVKEKTHAPILELLPKEAEYYFTKANIPRALNEHELEKLANKTGLYGSAYSTVKAAFKAAISSAEKEDMIFIGGSNFIVAEVLVDIE